MKGHFGAVLTSGLTAIAVALMVLFALIVAHPVPDSRTAADGYATPGRSVPWTPAPPHDEPARERDVKPREQHRPPPRNRGSFFPEAPRPPKRAAA